MIERIGWKAADIIAWHSSSAWITAGATWFVGELAGEMARGRNAFGQSGGKSCRACQTAEKERARLLLLRILTRDDERSLLLARLR